MVFTMVGDSLHKHKIDFFTKKRTNHKNYKPSSARCTSFTTLEAMFYKPCIENKPYEFSWDSSVLLSSVQFCCSIRRVLRYLASPTKNTHWKKNIKKLKKIKNTNHPSLVVRVLQQLRPVSTNPLGSSPQYKPSVLIPQSTYSVTRCFCEVFSLISFGFHRFSSVTSNLGTLVIWAIWGHLGPSGPSGATRDRPGFAKSAPKGMVFTMVGDAF